MIRHLKNSLFPFLILLLAENIYAQNDVTLFMGIPVDGLKSEMVQKLKSKGFIANSQSKDVLNGEFNGTDVNIFVLTNNNKVWRIAVADANTTDQGNIKIRFNNLVQQFNNNKNYVPLPDSMIAKYTIPEDEDISYESIINKKRYQALFYQKTKEYESLTKERDILLAKGKLNNEEGEKLTELKLKIFQESIKGLNKMVWFMIKEEDYGKFCITMFYENINNKANGEGL